MLDRRITKEGVLIFDGGRILIDGWQTNALCMGREVAVLACLFVADRLMQEAIEQLREAGAGHATLGIPESARPQPAPLNQDASDHTFDPWYRALRANDTDGFDSALRYTNDVVNKYGLSRESAMEIEGRMVMLACEVGGFGPFPARET